jgi:murein DD-endopeptidase MepM/ murein hydrolase activator NlpD
MLGQRYAFDFLRTDGRRIWNLSPAGPLRALVVGVPTAECYGWGAPVHAAIDGEVVVASEGYPERRRVHPLRELMSVLRMAVTFDPRTGLQKVLGNHVILGDGQVYAAYAHLRPGSVAVRAGQRVASGDLIGRVGHTGNSTSPHLHFQLMDAIDPLAAQAIACRFRAYDVRLGSDWRRVEDGVPGRKDRIRSIEAASSTTP